MIDWSSDAAKIARKTRALAQRARNAGSIAYKIALPETVR
jgi:hypothetical protein